MRRSWVLWSLAILLTLASAWWQRTSGPTYPVRGTMTIGGQAYAVKLDRSHGGAGDQPVRIVVADPEVRGDVVWRRYPTSDPWQVLPMVRNGDVLETALPHQPPAGKLEYEVRLSRGGEQVAFPERAAITRFKGDVSPWLLAPHVLAMFLSMLLSSRAGLAALVGLDARRHAWVAIVLLVIGGFVFGPAIQKQAFGDWWTGVPFGWDLTDNKTLVAGLAWLMAAVAMRGGRPARAAIVFAAATTLVVFMIPHSVWGSQIDWSKEGL
jgi:hypothetical protein